MAKLTKEEKAARKAERKKAGKGLWAEFKEFINRGNAFMLAVGVVIGGAFSAIVNAFVNMLTSLATWPVPGGLKGLVSVLPAVTDAQKGAAFAIIKDGVVQKAADGTVLTENIQAFQMANANERVIAFAAAQGKEGLTVESSDFIQWKNSLLGLYDLHGTTYTSKMSAIIDWGTLLNAVIAFIIIAIVLFIIVKLANAAAAKKAAIEAKRLEAYYEKHPEERPVEPEPEAPKPTQEELLTAILGELRKQNAPKK